MTKKRKQPDFNPSDTLFTSKRSRPNQPDGSDDLPTAAQARIDPTYGQRGAFPGLDDAYGEDELFYGPANDGLEYLRMVRSEAKTVPNLLVAPVSTTAAPHNEGIYEDYPQGYYADGAYTATPFPAPHPTQRTSIGDSEPADLDPQEAYYTALLTRFSTLRTHLQHPPPLPANGILNIPAGFNTHKEWRNKLLRTMPKMGILALLQQEQVIRGLEVLEDILTVGNLRELGGWAWGLLGRCRELGTMGSEEVGVLRRVGKKAVWLLRRERAGEIFESGQRGEMQQEDASEGDSEDDGEEEDDHEQEEKEENLIQDLKEMSQKTEADSITPLDPITATTENPRPLLSPLAEEGSDTALAEARARALASLHSAPEEPNLEVADMQQERGSSTNGIEKDTGTCVGEGIGQGAAEGEEEDKGDREAIHATLDMIITIVGEVYGQRDLLDGRLLWDEM